MYECTEANAKIGNINSQTFISPTLTENYLESIEKRLSSSGIFSQDSATLEILQKMHTISEDRQINPELFEVRIIFMSMSNDIDWTKENSKVCLSNSEKVKNYAKRFQRGHRSLLGPGDEEKWYGTHTYKPEGKWNTTADDMVARGMGSSRHATNRRRWTREGPGTCVCAVTLSSAKWHTQGRKGELNSSRDTV